jgi:Family of unknown function (DUF6328)
VAQLKDKIENALNETRILILGGQVLIGVSYRAFFEQQFTHLTAISQVLLTVGLGIMLLSLGLLVAPAPYHRIVEEGKISDRLHGFVTAMLGIGLLPFAVGLGADMYVAGERVGGATWAVAGGISSFVAAVVCWYGLELARRVKEERELRISMVLHPGRKHMTVESPNDEQEPQLGEKIKEVLIEARMVLPGAQALLGFQFIIVLMEGFNQIPISSKYIHFASLAAIAVCTILLIMPAAYHRIVFQGEDCEEFHAIASRLLLLAMIFLALGVSGDFLVVCRKLTGSLAMSIVVSAGLLAFFYGLWFGWTTYMRKQESNKV